MEHRDDHPGQARDVVAPTGARQPNRGVVVVTDDRAVQVAVSVDLCTAHEADIHIAALQQQQHVGDRENHVRAAGAALLVGRRRQLSRHDKRTKGPALEQDGQSRSVHPLRKRCRQKRNADTRENDLAVIEKPTAHDRQQLGFGKPIRVSHCRRSFPGGSHRSCCPIPNARDARPSPSDRRLAVRDIPAPPLPHPAW